MQVSRTYVTPVKKIIVPEDVEALKTSPFLQDYLKLVLGMQKSVMGKKMGDLVTDSPIISTMSPLLSYLDHLALLLE